MLIEAIFNGHNIKFQETSISPRILSTMEERYIGEGRMEH